MTFAEDSAGAVNEVDGERTSVLEREHQRNIHPVRCVSGLVEGDRSFDPEETRYGKTRVFHDSLITNDVVTDTPQLSISGDLSAAGSFFYQFHHAAELYCTGSRGTSCSGAIFLAGGLMLEDSGLFPGYPVLYCNKVHCSQAAGDMDVVPVFSDFNFVETRALTVNSGANAMVQSGFNFRQIVPGGCVDRNNRLVCPKPRVCRIGRGSFHNLHDLNTVVPFKSFNYFSDPTPLKTG
jgi:hypothetical protein